MGSGGGTWSSGAIAILPLAAGIFPFGLVYGAAVAQSSISPWVGGAASGIMVSGAAQVVLLELMDQGTPWLIAVGTALVINARFVMYSAALAPAFADFPVRARIPMAHLMTDQVAVTSLLYNESESDPVKRMHYYVGAGVAFVASWLAGTWLGVLVGGDIPDSWQLGFAIPLMFIALLVPSIRGRSGAVAAVVGASITFLANAAPYGLGLIIGASAGIAAGMVVRE